MAAATVRRLEPGDEAVVQALSKLDGRPPLDDEGARRFLENPRNHLFAAFVAGEPVGALLAQELDRRHGDEPKMLLYDLGVVEEHRRRGVGRALMEAFRDLCRHHGYPVGWVLTDEDNVPARALYEAFGGVAEPAVMYSFRF